ncbi:ubiquinone biosynthesis hydroxylase UbiH [Comamonas aquatica DA1877]|uniref:Ubiquinone biosynthesis hydroxylase UbiH n=1 Tax=Comamonas aquatica DA1877 TaxID=1457173 RepID=A0A014QCB6_9BURK|nr:FAD-dependent monooxygenase [Comamonas aquatica]EXU80802.1 ubiquinone biosynthesis hydroxylase UbiH [Comamonas aquatica DA1877]
MAHTFDVCIRGAGIVGRTLALLLARERLRVALVAPQRTEAPQADVRAYALNASSKQLLESLRTWPDAAHVTAVRHMEVHGDVDGSVYFDALAQGVDALAWIVDVPALEQRLAEAVRYQPQIEVVAAPVEAPLTVVCEGRASLTRAEFGVDFAVTPYGQHAIATRLRCELPHGQVARQWFSPQGILAFLPLDGADGHSVAVVWSLDHSQVDHWLAAEAADFSQALADISQHSLGQLELQGPRMAWPLQQAIAKRWCGAMPGTAEGRHPRSWALAGDAAHNVHPLAGQGLNLGLADAQTLARILRTRDAWRSTGDLKLLRRYERERKAGLAPLGAAMDGLQQLFTRTEAPLQTLRNWGLRSFERSGLLKDWTVRQAMGLDR